jgi:hypothetical protein
VDMLTNSIKSVFYIFHFCWAINTFRIDLANTSYEIKDNIVTGLLPWWSNMQNCYAQNINVYNFL